MIRDEQLIKQSGLFDSLTEAEFNTLVNNAIQVDRPSGGMIMREGDIGHECYIIIQGSVQVFTTASDGQEIVLVRRETGEFIGEQSLLPNSDGRRNASMRAKSDVVLLRITKDEFLQVLAVDHPLNTQLIERGKAQIQDILLRQSSLFRSLSQGEQGNDWYREERFASGEILFREGDSGDKVYLVLSGTADVLEEGAEDDSQQVIVKVAPGRTVGERAFLEEAPRSNTVRASDDLHVIAIDGSFFVQLHEKSPELREYMQTLKQVYPLAGRGFVTQYFGKFMEMDCLTTVASLLSGATAISSLVIGEDIFNMSVVSEELTLEEKDDQETLYYQDEESGIKRELVLSGHNIVGITSQGHWDELGQIYQMVLEEEPVDQGQVALFRIEGILQREFQLPVYQDHEIVCHCLQIRRGELRLAIEGGCRTANDLMEATGAGTVCGSCRVSLGEMVGQSDWLPVRIAQVIPQSDRVRSFQFKPHRGHETKIEPAKPGQHIVVQAYIDGNWVQRPYTISTAADEATYREITVQKEPHGFFSTWLFEDNWKDALMRISDPQGDYYAELIEPDPIVHLVGGIGITPALATCRSMVQQESQPSLYIDYSSSAAENFIYVEELKTAAQQKNIDVHFRATEQTGRLKFEDVQQITQRYPNARYYLCGPEGYLTSVEGLLEQAHVPQERINIEVFTSVGEQPVTVSHNYFYVGVLLLLGFAVQDIFQLKWPWLETLQADETYRRWSGLVLTLYVAAQFILPWFRWRGKFKQAARYYHLHKYQGILAPLVYYIHATTMGYAYLFLLSMVYFANFTLGLFNQEVVAKPAQKQKYAYYWVIGHVLLSILTVALVAFHIYMVFGYQ